MRLVTRNCCRGRAEAKLPLLSTLNPSIAVVQECGRPSEDSASCLWFGDRPRQGVAVLGITGDAALAAEERSQGCERFLRATPGNEWPSFVPRSGTGNRDASSFDDPVPLTRHDSIDIRPRGARKKRSHPWLSSLRRYRGIRQRNSRITPA